MKLYTDFNVDKHASPAINFRDSLNHFCILYEAYKNKDEKTFIMNYSSIFEHLHRGFKDSIIYLLFTTVYKLKQIMENPRIQEKIKKELRKWLHRLKNVMLDIRLNNIFIERISKDEFVKDIIGMYFDLFDYLDNINCKNVFLRLSTE